MIQTIKILATIVALCALGIVIYLQHPLFGKLPSGERFARIAQSPNHTDGPFQNQIDTPMPKGGHVGSGISGQALGRAAVDKKETY